MSLLLAVVFFLAPLAGAASSSVVRFRTSDGWTISASYHPPKKGGPVAVLIHGVGAGHSEWDELSRKLWTLGLGTLALDLRGHGQSQSGPNGQRGYESFEAADWASAQEDIAAALRFLAGRGVAAKHVGLIGGSIGANLASREAEASDVAWVVLLSPGMDYRGVTLADVAGRPECVAASSGDAYALQTALALVERPNVTFLQADSGHGAQMLRDPGFLDKLLSWIGKAATAGSKPASR